MQAGLYRAENKSRYWQPFRLLVLLACIVSLSACGFHLRGAYQLPETMATTFLETSNDNSELVRFLKRTLMASDVELVESKDRAQAHLHVLAEKQSKRVLSVDSRGRAREYELSYSVDIVLSADEKILLEQQHLTLTRDFLFDTEDVLGKGREEAMLIRDMQQDMVRLIMLRLQAARLR